MNHPEIPVPLYTIRIAFTELGRRVSLALRTQLGDTARLQDKHSHCQRLLSLIFQVNIALLCHNLGQPYFTF